MSKINLHKNIVKVISIYVLITIIAIIIMCFVASRNKKNIENPNDDTTTNTTTTKQNTTTKNDNTTTTTKVATTTTTKATTKKNKKTTTTTTTTPVETTTTTEYIETYYAEYSPYDLQTMGVIYWGNYRYTYYSELVLPGYGLAIDGRHVDENGFVCDGNGYICVASSALAWGTIVDTPFGKQGRVYDSGCAYDTIDIYVHW